jgi:carbonic anhydrase
VVELKFLSRSIFLQLNRKNSQLEDRKIYLKLMKTSFNRIGLFAGLVTAALLMGACQSSKTACCTMPVTSSAVQIHATNGFTWFISPSAMSGTNLTMISSVQTKASQAAMTPQQALAELRDGNARFVAGRPLLRNLSAEVKATAAGQYPFAVVLSCLDSRQPIEIVFDQGIGDIFSARVAGNVLNDDILGSMEFACKVSGAKLIAVVGHSNCGAIKGAVDDVELGNLTGLLAKIRPAIDAVPADVQPRNSKNYAFVNEVAEANVKLVMKEIRERSPILREMLDKGEIELVGGMYDLSTGNVQFFDN